MAVKIRLKRMGNRNRPFYRLVVSDSRVRRDGDTLEDLGWYNPIKNPAQMSFNEESILKWMGRGAQLSETARSLLKRAGILGKIHAQQGGQHGNRDGPPEEDQWRVGDVQDTVPAGEGQNAAVDPSSREVEEE